MSVFITIDSCYTLAHYKYTLNLKENGIKDVNLPKHPKSAQSPWGAAYEDDKLIYLQTHEPQCAVNFDVGYPLLMLDKSTDTQELGVITDIERTQALHINFTVSKITQHFTGVQIKSDGNPTTKAIIYTHQGRYFLMCVNNDLFWKGKTIEIEDLENNQRVICIKALLCDYGRTKIYETF